ncbi:hypothetical protein KFE25_010645 [Diacronema lutheri]|uniref:V-type proton ATPase subunit G n=1 Tax=Diacronema lutheri TaxID=2081491 RepID=A0A8J5XHD3_DIALT|nr:hypothetical protein KFE25_010645 [Diacronema lutheri]
MMGIQRLLEAESQASEVVAQAKKDKVLRLKLAKEEAENEIMAYRQLREDQFQKYSADRTGNTGDFTKKVQAETDSAMKNIQISIDANKEKIITSLLQSVTTVSI